MQGVAQGLKARLQPDALSLTWPVFAAVLLGALLHASWNVLVKSSTDKSLDMAVIHVMASLLSMSPHFFCSMAGRLRC